MNCLLWCAAYHIGVSSEVLIKELGHDGTEVLWDEYTDVRKYKGFPLPEVVDLFYMRGYLLAPIMLSPMIAPGTDAKAIHLWSPEHCGKRYYNMTSGKRAILTGFIGDIGHAIVLDRDKYIDPRTGKAETSTPDDFRIQEAYILVKDMYEWI
jgi:hypothetical protein